MKKILAILVATGLGITNVYAGITTITSDNIKTMSRIYSWKVDANHTDGYWNLLGEKDIKTRFYINEYFTKDGKEVKADKVTLTCNNNNSYLKPGSWTVCIVKPGKVADVSISQQDAHNGAEGFTEVFIN